MRELVYLNGWVGSFDDAFISVNDRGFNFGDGVYEVVRVYGGIPFAMGDHLERLEFSATAIKMEMPWSKEQLEMFTMDLLDKSKIKEAMVYLQVSRGTAHRNHTFSPDIKPNLLITVRHVPEISPSMYREGVKIISQPEFRWQMCHVKSISLLASVLAKQRAADAGAAEAVFVMDDGTVTECSASNIFIYKDDALFTHPADNRILKGVTRKYVLEIARGLGIAIKVEPFSFSDMLGAAEVFFTSTIVEIMPVVKADHHIIGNGKPGQLAGRIHDAFTSLRHTGI
ncbi:MAG: aminotransferase class IV [Firmicutes bacterium]|nr:aminotransferase class IV [Bacillota bacterium]